MGKKPLILIDTNIIIRVFRGAKELKPILDSFEDEIAISVITYMELLYGAKTKSRIIDLNKQMKAYEVFHLNESISERALSLFLSYNIKHTIGTADALIAATALHYQLPLFTYNKKDFNFIKGLSLYETE